MGTSHSFSAANSLRRQLICLTNHCLLFYSANDNYDKEKEEYYGLTISSNGNVGWFYPTIFKSSCTIDVTYFPFDDQVMKISLTKSNSKKVKTSQDIVFHSLKYRGLLL